MCSDANYWETIYQYVVLDIKGRRVLVMPKVYFGSTSKKRLATCHPAWSEIMIEAANDSECPCDFGIVCGWRNEWDQDKAFMDGKSNARWGESDHNVMIGNKPWSLGIDIAPYSSEIKNYLWEDAYAFNALASHIIAVAGRLGYRVEWGGNYKLRGGTGDPGHFSLKLK